MRVMARAGDAVRVEAIGAPMGSSEAGPRPSSGSGGDVEAASASVAVRAEVDGSEGGNVDVGGGALACVSCCVFSSAAAVGDDRSLISTADEAGTGDVASCAGAVGGSVLGEASDAVAMVGRRPLWLLDGSRRALERGGRVFFAGPVPSSIR